ncbi:MAG: glycosyltransferase [Patescibacteria group bacterium]|nr:glycosyltransferase [Patescibacteria group bacterium]MDE2116285.1 glycosyltransferase [Patescibacteria group bacterium]
MPSKTEFLIGSPRRLLLFCSLVMGFVYLIILTFYFPHGTEWLFWLLIAGEIFHTWQAAIYIHTVWRLDYRATFDASLAPWVDVFITVAGEPVDIVEATAVAARDMEYPNHRVYILNDGLVAKRDNWRDVVDLARRLGIGCITRTVPGGAKAGNINNALAETARQGFASPYIVVFDADHIPHTDFLKKTVGYFVDPKMGFVQTPQYYKNSNNNAVTISSWEQQELFFGPICRGRNRFSCATMCGTNMVISRRALGEVGGMCTESIAEDFATGMFMHEKGWKSLYVPEVLAEGLAPEDFLSYTKQQFRWARGGLDVLFRYGLLFRRGLSFKQKLQYISAVSYFFSGAVVVLDICLPLIFFYFGLVPVRINTMLLALVFIPYMFLTIAVLTETSNERFSFRALSFSMSSFTIHIQALWSAMTGQKVGFSVTEKKGLRGNFIKLTAPHIIYIVLVIVGVAVAIFREGVSASVINNAAWCVFNIGMFIPYILASAPESAVKRYMSRVYLMIFQPEKAIAAKLKVAGTPESATHG